MNNILIVILTVLFSLYFTINMSFMHHDFNNPKNRKIRLLLTALDIVTVVSLLVTIIIAFVSIARS